MPFKIAPNPEHCRDKFVVDIYSSEGNITSVALTFILVILDTLEIKTKNWIECKNALMQIFIQLGMPKFFQFSFEAMA